MLNSTQTLNSNSDTIEIKEITNIARTLTSVDIISQKKKKK